MDGKLPVRVNNEDDNRGQRHGETPSGGRGPAGLTGVTNHLSDLHRRTNEVVQRVCIRGRGAILWGRPFQGGERKRCQPCRLDT